MLDNLYVNRPTTRPRTILLLYPHACYIMVAAPGVPGGAIMAALAPLSSILGFDEEAQA